MERAAELEAEVERLRAELDDATAAKVRVAAEQTEGGTEEEKALRVANVILRRENDRLGSYSRRRSVDPVRSRAFSSCCPPSSWAPSSS
jgi:hypothetical protein